MDSTGLQTFTAQLTTIRDFDMRWNHRMELLRLLWDDREKETVAGKHRQLGPERCRDLILSTHMAILRQRRQLQQLLACARDGDMLAKTNLRLAQIMGTMNSAVDLVEMMESRLKMDRRKVAKCKDHIEFDEAKGLRILYGPVIFFRSQLLRTTIAGGACRHPGARRDETTRRSREERCAEEEMRIHQDTLQTTTDIFTQLATLETLIHAGFAQIWRRPIAKCDCGDRPPWGYCRACFRADCKPLRNWITEFEDQIEEEPAMLELAYREALRDIKDKQRHFREHVRAIEKEMLWTATEYYFKELRRIAEEEKRVQVTSAESTRPYVSRIRSQVVVDALRETTARLSAVLEEADELPVNVAQEIYTIQDQATELAGDNDPMTFEPEVDEQEEIDREFEEIMGREEDGEIEDSLLAFANEYGWELLNEDNGEEGENENADAEEVSAYRAIFGGINWGTGEVGFENHEEVVGFEDDEEEEGDVTLAVEWVTDEEAEEARCAMSNMEVEDEE
jgi:hypothetical protein